MILVACLVTLGLWRGLRPANWKDAADAQQVVLSGKFDAQLLDFLHPEEMAALGLTSDQTRKVIEEVVVPNLKDVKLVPGPQGTTRSGSQVVISQLLVVGEKQIPAGTVVYDLPGGPKVLLSNLAITALRAIQMRGEGGQLPGWKGVWNATVTKMEEIGMKGAWHIGTGQVRPWPRQK